MNKCQPRACSCVYNILLTNNFCKGYSIATHVAKIEMMAQNLEKLTEDVREINYQ